MDVDVRFDVADMANPSILHERLVIDYEDPLPWVIRIGETSAMVRIHDAEQAHEIAEAWRRIELAILERIHGPEAML